MNYIAVVMVLFVFDRYQRPELLWEDIKRFRATGVAADRCMGSALDVGQRVISTGKRGDGQRRQGGGGTRGKPRTPPSRGELADGACQTLHGPHGAC